MAEILSVIFPEGNEQRISASHVRPGEESFTCKSLLHAELGLEAPNLTLLLLFGGIFFVLHMIMVWQKDLPNVSVHTAGYMVPSPFPNLNSSHLALIFFLPLKLVLFFFTKACFRHLSF